jgi:hypothetical protein
VIGRRSKGKYTPQKNNLIKDLVGNYKNEDPVPDPNNTMINVTNELSDAPKKSLKE